MTNPIRVLLAAMLFAVLAGCNIDLSGHECLSSDECESGLICVSGACATADELDARGDSSPDAGSDAGSDVGADAMGDTVDDASADAADAAPTCGDGRVDPGEDCDLGSTNGEPGESCTFDCRTDADADGVAEDEDCDDLDPSVGLGGVWFRDADDDGFGSGEDMRVACERPNGYVEQDGDCDDGAPVRNPGAVEVVGDGVDQDCDGKELCWVDADGDGVRGEDTIASTMSCQSEGTLGSDAPSGDCDDGSSSTYPDAPELCDEVDNDCDELFDEAVEEVASWPDGDNDGFGNGDAEPVFGCAPPPGYVTNGDDCDDGSAEVEGAITWFRDRDNDGFGDEDAAVIACVAPDGYVEHGGDCDDGNAAVSPDAPERCDGTDNDCNLLVDDDPVDADSFYIDEDGDQFGDDASMVLACEPREGLATAGGDCDDENSDVYPGAPEAVGVGASDENCDGFDGIADRGIFVAPWGDDAAAATREAPVLTLQEAVRRVDGERNHIYAAAADYVGGTLEVPGGASLFGGYNDDWQRTEFLSAYLSLGAVGMVLEPGVGERVIDSWWILSSPGVPGQSDSSIALAVIGGDALTIRSCTLEAGDGVDGADGADGYYGAPGAQGQAGTSAGQVLINPNVGVGGEGGEGGCFVGIDDLGWLPSADAVDTFGGDGADGASAGPGLRGEDGADAGPMVPGGAGGEGGSSDDPILCRGLPGVSGANGANGLDGDAAIRPVGQARGMWDELGWVAGDGARGESGAAGSGGGGGGSGEVCSAGFEVELRSGAGGGGGGGGCGGGGGAGGRGGGGSFGIVAVGSGPITVVDSEVITRSGGTGGDGGLGGQGGEGGSGGRGGVGAEVLAGGGGRGGAGGMGGSGGPGGGGAGGSCAAALLVEDATIEWVDVEIELGEPGEGGAGAATSNGDAAMDGEPGRCESVLVY